MLDLFLFFDLLDELFDRQQRLLLLDHLRKELLGIGSAEMGLETGHCQVAVVLVASVDEDSSCRFGDIVRLHLCHLPPALCHRVDQRPNYVDRVLQSCYFGPQLSIQVEMQGLASVVLVEQKVLHQ